MNDINKLLKMWNGIEIYSRKEIVLGIKCLIMLHKPDML